MKILRFNKSVRILHWSHALVFIWLLITGLQLFLTSKSLLGDPLIKMIHLYVSPIFILLPAVIYISGRRSVSEDIRELVTLTDNDLIWFLDFFRMKKTKPSGKFNGGQKGNFLVTFLLIIGLSFSGLVVWMRSMFSVDFVEFNFMIHDFLSIISIMLLTGHIIFTLYYSESMGGIIFGTVDEKWAKIHYPEWFRIKK